MRHRAAQVREGRSAPPGDAESPEIRNNLTAVNPMRRSRILVATVVGVVLLGGWVERVPLVSRAAALALGATYLGDSAVRRQRSSEDCGVAALNMIFDAHSIPFTAGDSLRQLIQRRGRGLSFAEMSVVSASAGVAANGYMMSIQAFDSVPLPAIAHLKQHFVVVDRVTASGVELRDPLFGRMRFPTS